MENEAAWSTWSLPHTVFQQSLFCHGYTAAELQQRVILLATKKTHLIELALGLRFLEEWLVSVDEGELRGCGHPVQLACLVLCAGSVCFCLTQRRSWDSMKELSRGKLRPSKVDSTSSTSSGSCTHDSVPHHMTWSHDLPHRMKRTNECMVEW